jgi:hypothetical protein
MPDEIDIVNQAVLKAAETAFRAAQMVQTRFPNPIGETRGLPRLTEADIKRLLEK